MIDETKRYPFAVAEAFFIEPVPGGLPRQPGLRFEESRLNTI